MSAAIALARSQLGRTAPNPAVGCVLVRDGRVIATGATADGGRPHAERQALDRAGNRADGGTAYVTLEPCAHHGQTPPCADALVAAGIARVVIACTDEDPRVSGRGIAILQNAGIAVTANTLTVQAAPLYAGFFHRLRTGLPLVSIDARRTGYDGVLDASTPDALNVQLHELGSAGASRVHIHPDHPLAGRYR